jgi:nucleoid DNA-binding protein
MKRSELIDALCKENPHLTAKQVEEAVVLFFEEITQALAHNGRVEQGLWILCRTSSRPAPSEKS